METFLVVTTWSGEGSDTAIQWVEATDAPKQPRKPPQQRTIQSQIPTLISDNRNRRKKLKYLRAFQVPYDLHTHTYTHTHTHSSQNSTN
jgi:hypothetical protein